MGQRKSVMLEYAALAGAELRFFFGSLFNFASVRGVALIVTSGVALTLLGYLWERFWGAVITFSIGSFIFLYFKGLLPI